jgi:hypothetical protein
VALPDKYLARNSSLTSLNSGIPRPSVASATKRILKHHAHSRSVCVGEEESKSLIEENMRSKSKERPHIPKLNLDYSYLEQKCIERDLIEK